MLSDMAGCHAPPQQGAMLSAFEMHACSVTAFHGRFNQFHGLHLLQILLQLSYLEVRRARR